jgi:L-2-hydroxyglutarate oxidase LhgO
VAAGDRFDAVVVGGGILGLATASELLRRRPDWSVVVFEKERELAAHQTGRNSGVIHTGIYYAAGSLKAQLCREGRELLFTFCDEEGIPYELCGKVVVAVEDGERAALSELERRGRANGVQLERIDGRRLRELEPHCAGNDALHVPGTGLVDFRAVSAALARRIARDGGQIATGTAVLRVDESSSAVHVATGNGLVEARLAICCAGVGADALAGGTRSETRIIPFRGDYFALKPDAARLCRNLIYPVPDARFPFLGVHVNRRPDGQVWAGPNAVVALAREGYRRRDFAVRDAWSTLTYPGFLRLAREHWRLGLREVLRDWIRPLYAAEVRRYLPDLSAGDLAPAPAGIRAQAVARDGRVLDDFLFREGRRTLHVLNAPSPAATSSLAIARRIVDKSLSALN